MYVHVHVHASVRVCAQYRGALELPCAQNSPDCFMPLVQRQAQALFALCLMLSPPSCLRGGYIHTCALTREAYG